MNKVKLGVSIGTIPAGDRSPERFWRWIDVCEQEGIDSIWLSDRIVGDTNSLEPIITFAAIAGRTRRMKFGPSVLVLPLRQPVVLAKEVATLDFLANGRMLMAVGVGVDDEKEWTAVGISKSERGARTDEAMVLMRRLWTEDRVTFHGRFFHCDEVSITPKPVQANLPIWVGGHTLPALRRTAALGDGWMPSFVTPEEFASGKAEIHRLEREFNREIEEDHYGTLVLYHLAGTVEAARRAAEPHTARFRARQNVALDRPYFALGTANDVKNTVEQYIAAGATKFIMRPLCDPDQMEEQLALLGREVIPHFTPARVG